MKKWHVKVNLDFDVECNETELYEAIMEVLREQVENLDIWDEEFVVFEDLGEVEE